jgi:hypothetical protein
MTQGTKTVKELCAAYKVGRRTFKKMLVGAGIDLAPHKRILMPLQVAQIVKAYGEPGE